MVYPGISKALKPCIHCGFYKKLLFFVRKSSNRSIYKIFKTCNQCSVKRHNRYLLDREINNLRTQSFVIGLLQNKVKKIKLSDIKKIFLINKYHDNDYLLGEIFNLYYL